ncbi:hypothetical protein LO771_14935 [Streptacidiphilus sp. ASG 303]|uniref:hypothetical protein n=1 Tax=Streptacidiphilus sp. ASG 303 TaxID=2896847 RepID=UPI001E5E2F63|nr:hypothetical protein [Streptacidiphilus sp. ASG 303]MCD0483655.1 hypothetical protein [Streptacidiphilus sp. ASG 303]
MLDSPVVGMAPWIVFSVLVGPGRFETAVVLSLVLALVIVVGGHLGHSGRTWKLLELCDVAFFAALAVIGLLASAGTHRWLETYAGELSNLALAAIACGSIAVRRPFTLPYAREETPRELWDDPVFVRTNYVVTGAWAAAFLVAAAAGAYGDLVLHDPNELWTGWIIQIGAILAALRFTTWYPDVVRARARREAGVLAPPAPPLADLLLPLTGYLVPVGVVVLALGSGPAWLGAALVLLGVLLSRALGRRRRQGDPGGAG